MGTSIHSHKLETTLPTMYVPIAISLEDARRQFRFSRRALSVKANFHT